MSEQDSGELADSALHSEQQSAHAPSQQLPSHLQDTQHATHFTHEHQQWTEEQQQQYEHDAGQQQQYIDSEQQQQWQDGEHTQYAGSEQTEQYEFSSVYDQSQPEGGEYSAQHDSHSQHSAEAESAAAVSVEAELQDFEVLLTAQLEHATLFTAHMSEEDRLRYRVMSEMELAAAKEQFLACTPAQRVSYLDSAWIHLFESRMKLQQQQQQAELLQAQAEEQAEEQDLPSSEQMSAFEYLLTLQLLDMESSNPPPQDGTEREEYDKMVAQAIDEQRLTFFRLSEQQRVAYLEALQTQLEEEAKQLPLDGARQQQLLQRIKRQYAEFEHLITLQILCTYEKEPPPTDESELSEYETTIRSSIEAERDTFYRLPFQRREQYLTVTRNKTLSTPLRRLVPFEIYAGYDNAAVFDPVAYGRAHEWSTEQILSYISVRRKFVDQLYAASIDDYTWNLKQIMGFLRDTGQELDLSWVILPAIEYAALPPAEWPPMALCEPITDPSSFLSMKSATVACKIDPNASRVASDGSNAQATTSYGFNTGVVQRSAWYDVASSAALSSTARSQQAGSHFSITEQQWQAQQAAMRGQTGERIHKKALEPALRKAAEAMRMSQVREKLTKLKQQELDEQRAEYVKQKYAAQHEEQQAAVAAAQKRSAIASKQAAARQREMARRREMEQGHANHLLVFKKRDSPPPMHSYPLQTQAFIQAVSQPVAAVPDIDAPVDPLLSEYAAASRTLQHPAHKPAVPLTFIPASGNGARLDPLGVLILPNQNDMQQQSNVLTIQLPAINNRSATSIVLPFPVYSPQARMPVPPATPPPAAIAPITVPVSKVMLVPSRSATALPTRSPQPSPPRSMQSSAASITAADDTENVNLFTYGAAATAAKVIPITSPARKPTVSANTTPSALLKGFQFYGPRPAMKASNPVITLQPRYTL